MKPLVWLVPLVASLSHAQVLRLTDVDTEPATRSSWVYVHGRFGDEVLLSVSNRYGQQFYLTGGTASSTRLLSTDQLSLLRVTSDLALFYANAPNPGLVAFAPDGGSALVAQPAFPFDAGTWSYSNKGVLGREILVSRCAGQSCDLLAIGPSGARGVPWAPTEGYFARSLGSKMLSLNSVSRQWVLFDGQSWEALTTLPSSYSGEAAPIAADSLLLELSGRLFIVSDDGGTRELLPTLPSNSFQINAATEQRALLAEQNWSGRTFLVSFAPDAGRRDLGSCRGPGSAVAAGGRLYFRRWNCSGAPGVPNTYDDEPWVIERDGGLRQLANLNPTGASDPRFLNASLGDRAFFAASRGFGREFWVTDGTVAGTQSLLAVGVASPWSYGQSVVQSAATDRFVAFPATLSNGTQELGLTDGTSAGSAVTDLTPGTRPSSPTNLLTLGREIAALTTTRDGGQALVAIDVVDGGVRTFLRGVHGDFGDQAPLAGRVALVFDDHVHGPELWLVPGADAGAELVDLDQGASGSRPHGLVTSSARLYFAASDGVSGRELWSSSGTAASTTMLVDLHPGPLSSNPELLTPFGTGVIFFADDGVTGREPWFSDGTQAGTRLLRDVAEGRSSSAGMGLLATGSRAWFAADDGQSGLELWTSDGTEAGTGRVLDALPGAAGSTPVPRIARGDELVFTVNLPSGRTLALTDGTPVGTQPLLRLDAQVFEAGVAAPTRWFFVLGEGDVHTLWVSEGTALTTRALHRWTSTSAPWLHAVGDEVVFASKDATTGEELWMSQTGDAGVGLVHDLATGKIDSWPGVPTQAGTRLVFAATDVDDDREPWVFLLPEAFDNTPPQVSARVTGTQRNGWYVDATTIAFVVEDPDSELVEQVDCDARDVTSEGVVMRRCIARSAGGATEVPVVLRRDVSAPQVACPAEQSLDATLDAGAIVDFEVSVTDSVDPAPSLRVTPPPRSLFPVGRTTVSATATDEAGHRGFCSFDVVVLPAPVTDPTLPPPTKLRPAGCGCSSADASATVALGLAALLARGRRRRLRRWLVPAVLLGAALASAAPRGKAQRAQPSQQVPSQQVPSQQAPSQQAPSALLQPPTEALASVSALYDALEYERVVTTAAELLARPELPLEVRLEAYRLQGCARAIVADPVDAEQPFRLLLRAQPEYELPDSTPPKILAVFRKVQSEERALANTLKQVERRRLVASLKLLGEPPRAGQGGQPLTFSWRVRDPLGAVDTVELPWRRAGQRSFSTLALERSEDGAWRGAIAGELTADERGFVLEYFVRTADAEGPLLVHGGEASPFTVAIAAGSVVPIRVKPFPAPAFWTTVALTVAGALLGGAFSVALPFQQAAYREAALAGRPGTELVAYAADGRAFATTANAAWLSAGVGGVVALVMLPFTRFDERPAAGP